MRCAGLLLLAVLTAPAPAQRPSVRAVELRCEYRRNPLGIDVTEPRLSWRLAASDPNARGVGQVAYRVLAASSEAALLAGKGDLWDTGRVASDQSAHVVYKGKPLSSRARIFWKVRVWDQGGRPSAWSDPASWSMGWLKPEDWKARWIGLEQTGVYKNPNSAYRNLEGARWLAPAPEYRRAFDLPEDRAVVHAWAVMAADPRFELAINGRYAGRGSSVRMPELIDIASLVRPGANEIAVKTAPNTKGMIGAVRIEFAAGDPLILRTDAQWGAAELGPYGIAPWGEAGYAEEHALPARMLRKEFDSPRAVARATAYVSAGGLVELYLNGARVGDHVLSPGLTDYTRRTLYVTYDVTGSIRPGRNTAGLWLGNGRYWAPRNRVPIGSVSYGAPCAIAQIEIEYDDGSRATVATDETWKVTAEGPITANNEYDGEDYDARREPAGWSGPGFDDSKWQPAQALAAPAGALFAEMAEPLRVTRTLRPEKVAEIRPGVFVYDMGQNMVGWCRLRVNGPAGARVLLRHAETLKPDGTLYVDNLRSARAADTYTLRGGGPEVWEPRFTYHGFRYVEVTGYPGKPGLDAIDGRVVHDDMPEIASFESSNKLLNQIHHNILWGVRGNYRSIPTDCPQRDERQGWLGDRSMVSRSESYLFDIAAFYTKWETDLADSQRPNGAIPDVSPAYWVIYNDDVTWPGTFLFIPGMLYDQYGDTRVLERNYPYMRKWVEHMRGYLKDGLMPKDTYGDWCVPPEDPKLIHSQDPARRTAGMLIGTAYYQHLLRLMARYARLLNKSEDAADYERLAFSVNAAFQKRFYDPARGVYGNGTQTSSILPLAFGMAPVESREALFGNLLRKIEEESNGHVGTGLVGAQWLMRTLSDNGGADVAYRIATQATYPGWGYMISRGATTIWELWNGDTADPAMNSGNHVMQIGDLGVWLYEYLAGIRTDPATPGFKRSIIRPYPVQGLDYVKGAHRTMYGQIESAWRRETGRFHLNVAIPPNTTALVYVPAKDAGAVTESGVPAIKARGVKFLGGEAGAAVFEVQSGRYAFAAAF